MKREDGTGSTLFCSFLNFILLTFKVIYFYHDRVIILSLNYIHV